MWVGRRRTEQGGALRADSRHVPPLRISKSPEHSQEWLCHVAWSFVEVSVGFRRLPFQPLAKCGWRELGECNAGQPDETPWMRPGVYIRHEFLAGDNVGIKRRRGPCPKNEFPDPSIDQPLDQIGPQYERDGLSRVSTIIQLHVKDSAITGAPTTGETHPFAGTSTQANPDLRGHCLNHCNTFPKVRFVPRVCLLREQSLRGSAEVCKCKVRAEFIACRLAPSTIAAKVVTGVAPELGEKLLVSCRQLKMRVEFFTVRMDLRVGLCGLCLEDRKVVRGDPEPECSFALKQSLHGALKDGFYFLWAGHDHRAEGIVPEHDAGRDSGHPALTGIEQSCDPAPLRDHDHAGSAKPRHKRCQEKAWSKHARFRRQTAHKRSEVLDFGGGRNNACSQGL